MYIVSDALEMGKAQDLILSVVKDVSMEDDIEPNTLYAQEYFDE
jgi:hypothetical protein